MAKDQAMFVYSGEDVKGFRNGEPESGSVNLIACSL